MIDFYSDDTAQPAPDQLAVDFRTTTRSPSSRRASLRPDAPGNAEWVTSLEWNVRAVTTSR